MTTIIYIIAALSIYHLWNSPNTTLFWTVVGLTILLVWVVDTIHTATKDVISERPELIDYSPVMLYRLEPVIRFWIKASMVVSFALVTISIYSFFVN